MMRSWCDRKRWFGDWLFEGIEPPAGPLWSDAEFGILRDALRGDERARQSASELGLWGPCNTVFVLGESAGMTPEQTGAMILRGAIGENELDLILRKIAVALYQKGWSWPLETAERYMWDVFEGRTSAAPERMPEKGPQGLQESTERLKQQNDLLPANIALTAALALLVGDLEGFATIRPEAWQTMPEAMEWMSAAGVAQ